MLCDRMRQVLASSRRTATPARTFQRTFLVVAHAASDTAIAATRFAAPGSPEHVAHSREFDDHRSASFTRAVEQRFSASATSRGTSAFLHELTCHFAGRNECSTNHNGIFTMRRGNRVLDLAVRLCDNQRTERHRPPRASSYHSWHIAASAGAQHENDASCTSG